MVLTTVGVNLAAPLLQRFLPKHVRVEDPSQFPLVVFVGMTVGAGLLAILLLAVALFRRRLVRAFLALGLVMAVLSATAFLMIPHGRWERVPQDALALGKHALGKMTGWVR